MPSKPSEAALKVARELVEELHTEGCEWHGATTAATCVDLHKESHARRIAAALESAQAEAYEAMRKACIEKADSMKAWYWKKWQVNLPDERALYWDGKATAASEIADALSRVEVKES